MRLLEDGALPIDASALRVVLEQLARNAAEHGASQLALTASDKSLLVQDNGPGIASGDKPRVFDPFFTTRRNAGGTGMGLSIVRAMLEANGAAITLVDADEGAAFLVTF